MLKTVPVHELHEQLEADPQSVLIDVRTPAEFAAGHVLQAKNIPLGTMVPAQVAGEWGREAEGKPIYIICQSGVRSQRFVEDLAAAGFEGALCVAGGTVAWQAAGLSLEQAMRAKPRFSGERRARIVAGLGVLAGCVLGFTVHSDFFVLCGGLGVCLALSGAFGDGLGLKSIL